MADLHSGSLVISVFLIIVVLFACVIGGTTICVTSYQPYASQDFLLQNRHIFSSSGCSVFSADCIRRSLVQSSILKFCTRIGPVPNFCVLERDQLDILTFSSFSVGSFFSHLSVSLESFLSFDAIVFSSD
jgi:hypothetical protein